MTELTAAWTAYEQFLEGCYLDGVEILAKDEDRTNWSRADGLWPVLRTADGWRCASTEAAYELSELHAEGGGWISA